MHTHLRIVALANIVLGALGALAGLLLAIGLGLVGFFSNEGGSGFVVGGIGLVVGMILAVLSLPQIIGGIGLLARRNWARYLLMVTSAIGLFAFPIGTMLGGYSLWVLTNDETRMLTAG